METVADAIGNASLAILEAQAAVDAVVLAEPDSRRVAAWLTIARLNLRRAERARKEVWRNLALEDVRVHTDSVKHLIALRSVEARREVT